MTSAPLRGIVPIPGDKSISHRALMLGALAVGETRIEGLAPGSDVSSTARALAAMGATISQDDSAWTVSGVGVGGLLQPNAPLDMGNSGTSARLLTGLAATHPIEVHFTGDPSLSRRPMDRVIGPLRSCGADIEASPGGRLPLRIRGLSPAPPFDARLGIASAQVKSALLLAGLNAAGASRIVEPIPTRDHSERLLAAFGADIAVGIEEGARTILLKGEAELKPTHVRIPGDFSSAAFLIAAALIVPGSEVRMEGVGINPMRIGLLEVLKEMGADVALSDERMLGGEPVADIVARHSALEAADIPPALVPAMIDEFPIFFVLAAFARGRSRARGLAELRFKESDRIATAATGLRAAGVRIEESDDGLTIDGTGGAPLPGNAKVESRLDHRVAMSFAVAGLHARKPIRIDDMAPVATSYPGFAAALERLRKP